MSISLRKETGPVIEDLKEARDLQSEVTGRAANNIYVLKRPDEVAWPDRGQNSWQQLASALSGFNPELRNMLRVGEQRFYEEQTAEGQKLWDENKQSWKDFTESHPEYQGLNPHLERGYKTAQLAVKGQDFNAAIQEFYTQNNFANETDPEKVRAALTTFADGWKRANVMDSGEFDAKLYAEAFLPIAQQAEGSILSQYGRDRSKEHVNRAIEHYSQECGRDIEEIMSGSIGNPDSWTQARVALGQRMQQQMDFMTANGLSRSQQLEAEAAFESLNQIVIQDVTTRCRPAA